MKVNSLHLAVLWITSRIAIPINNANIVMLAVRRLFFHLHFVHVVW